MLPIRNQRDRIAGRCAEVRSALASRPHEIIVVDDGSIDGSFNVLQRLAGDDPRLRVVRLRRGFGQTAALAAGFSRARGAAVVTLDTDGLVHAADIPRLLDETRSRLRHRQRLAA